MPDQPSSESLARIRALCHELAKKHRLDESTRDELCGHMEDKLAGYLSGSVKITEEDALHLVRVHFGDAAKIARQISREDQPFFSFRVDHERLYTALLPIIGFSTILTTPLGLYIWHLRQSQASAFHTSIPNWALPWQAAIAGIYLIAIFTTLYMRRAGRPTASRWTRRLNYLLLPAIPFGTLLGIYGLVMLDRERTALLA